MIDYLLLICGRDAVINIKVIAVYLWMTSE